MLSPRSSSSCGREASTASQIGCGRSWVAHDPKAIRVSGSAASAARSAAGRDSCRGSARRDRPDRRADRQHEDQSSDHHRQPCLRGEDRTGGPRRSATVVDVDYSATRARRQSASARPRGFAGSWPPLTAAGPIPTMRRIGAFPDGPAPTKHHGQTPRHAAPVAIRPNAPEQPAARVRGRALRPVRGRPRRFDRHAPFRRRVSRPTLQVRRALPGRFLLLRPLRGEPTARAGNAPPALASRIERGLRPLPRRGALRRPRPPGLDAARPERPRRGPFRRSLPPADDGRYPPPSAGLLPHHLGMADAGRQAPESLTLGPNPGLRLRTATSPARTAPSGRSQATSVAHEQAGTRGPRPPRRRVPVHPCAPSVPHPEPIRCPCTALHPDRAAGGDRDHRRADRPAAARRPGRPRGGPADPVHEQPEADRHRPAQLPLGRQLRSRSGSSSRAAPNPSGTQRPGHPRPALAVVGPGAAVALHGADGRLQRHELQLADRPGAGRVGPVRRLHRRTSPSR